MRRNTLPLSSSSAALAALAAAGILSYSPVASAQAAPAADTGNDHDAVVGHFAVGYFGISNLPVGTGTPGGTGGAGGAGVTETNIAAPVVGARYWFSPRIGVDAGIGFSDSSSGWGIGLHGGLPIALATSKHMTFELVPEATVAFAGNTAGNAPAEITYSGFLLDVGARVGGEIQFGFIGIPQLALQASIGVYLKHDAWGASTASQSGSGSSTVFTTSVGSDPWGIFTDNISALYYF
jgi:hypothetical protein